jgi:hypothetical protein
MVREPLLGRFLVAVRAGARMVLGAPFVWRLIYDHPTMGTKTDKIGHSDWAILGQNGHFETGQSRASFAKRTYQAIRTHQTGICEHLFDSDAPRIGAKRT